MRVLQFIARMNTGGTATYLSNLVQGLQAAGNQVLLVIGNVPHNEIEDPIVNTLPIKRISGLSRAISFKDFRAKKEFSKVVEEFQPDLIHTHTFKAGLIGRSLGRRFRMLPNLHTYHGHHLYDPEFNSIEVAVLNFIEKRLANRSNYLITVGEQVGRDLLKEGIGSENQYISIAPGIEDLHLRNRKLMLEKFEIPDDKKNLVWLGRFTKVKRPERLIEIANKLPECNVIAAGGGELFQEISEIAPKNLYLLGWQLKEEMLSLADIALLTSDSEGMPLWLIEAQMAGIPVASTDVGSVSEIVINGITGHFFSQDNMIIKIQELLQEIELTPEIKNKCSLNAKTLFNRDLMIEKHLRLYKKILEKTPKK